MEHEVRGEAQTGKVAGRTGGRARYEGGVLIVVRRKMDYLVSGSRLYV